MGKYFQIFQNDCSLDLNYRHGGIGWRYCAKYLGNWSDHGDVIETFSALLGLWEWNSLVTAGQNRVNTELDISIVWLNKLLNKQPNYGMSETPGGLGGFKYVKLEFELLITVTSYLAR